MKEKLIITIFIIVVIAFIMLAINNANISLDNKFNAFLIFSFFIGITILFILILIGNKSAFDFYKNAFNCIWNIETLCVTTYAAYVFTEYTLHDVKTSELIDWSKRYPLITSLFISIVLTTAIFRASSSFAEIFINKKDKIISNSEDTNTDDVSKPSNV